MLRGSNISLLALQRLDLGPCKFKYATNVKETTMKRMYILALLQVLLAQPAFATGDSYCSAVDGSGAKFGYSFGRVPGLALVDATIRAEGQHWSINKVDGAIPIIFAQGVFDGPQTIIDFADHEYSEIVASVRILSAVEGDKYGSVGILRIPGVGVFSMICE